MRLLTEQEPISMNDGSIKPLNEVASGETYTLPTATATRLGGVKVGTGLSVTSGGVLSADAEQYTLPAATAETLGGVKVGTGLSVTEDGTLSASGGGGGGGTDHLYLVGLKYNYAWLSFYFWSDNTTIDVDSVYTALNGFVDESFVWYYYPVNGYYTDGTSKYAIVGVQANNNSFIVFAPGTGQYTIPKGNATFTYKRIY